MLRRNERISRLVLSTARGRKALFRFGSIKILAHSPARAAVIISKKTAPQAVSRNRIRRRIYHILRGLLREKKLRYSIIIYPNKDALTAPFAELHAEVEKALVHASA